MTVAMDPPPSTDSTSSSATTTAVSTDPEALPTKTPDEPTTSQSNKTPMGPPPPKGSEPTSSPTDQVKPQQDPESQLVGDADSVARVNGAEEKREQRQSVEVPYAIPPWSGPPCHGYFLEVLKDGAIIDQLDVTEKGAYMFGRVDMCDFVLEHPTISRFHAVLQFKNGGDAYIYDLGSTHGTSVNKNQVKKKVYVDLHVGDVIRFGLSTRLYIFQGPSDLMPPEADLKSIRSVKLREEMRDMEASLLRAKVEASLADGISWGMGEDAIEEAEDEVDEITWQTYKGQLTEKQEKTRQKVIKRLEKIANMKKEIDAIRAKDIAQGGLTQGQQTQIARNEQRISQIFEELENLEETLNESIRESLGARAGRTSRGKKKDAAEEEGEEYSSDEDEFYDRTRKPSKQKSGDNKLIETADSLLDKKDIIVKQMEEKQKLLTSEDVTVPKDEVVETGDALDAFMSGLSSQLDVEKKDRLHKELSNLQSELDRVLYLLKIADPTGEASRKREFRSKEPVATVTKIEPVATVTKISESETVTQHPSEQSEKDIGREHPPNGSIEKQGTQSTPESSNKTEQDTTADTADGETTVYTVPKPQWLGAVEEKKKVETPQTHVAGTQETDQFVDYKDRKKILVNSDTGGVNEESGLENAAPGLIIRKRKQVEKSNNSEGDVSEKSSGADIKAEDAIALLLKHSRGYHASDEEVGLESGDVPSGGSKGKEKKKPKRVLGPERPSFLKSETDYETWVPPQGQSGDGRTSLNERYGY